MSEKRQLYKAPSMSDKYSLPSFHSSLSSFLSLLDNGGVLNRVNTILAFKPAGGAPKTRTSPSDIYHDPPEMQV